MAEAVRGLAPFVLGGAPVTGFGRRPGCMDCRPRGVSSTTRKCPVKGGARAAGRCSGSIYIGRDEKQNESCSHANNTPGS